jgi:hypothetical protein
MQNETEPELSGHCALEICVNFLVCCWERLFCWSRAPSKSQECSFCDRNGCRVSSRSGQGDHGESLFITPLLQLTHRSGRARLLSNDPSHFSDRTNSKGFFSFIEPVHAVLVVRSSRLMESRGRNESRHSVWLARFLTRSRMMGIVMLLLAERQ